VRARNYGTLRRPDLFVRIGPWQARITSPYYGGRFGNGSRWFSGWHRWAEEEDA
jgi:hypothetical protein